jgi:NhaA family Na+:H+ antiporter
MVAAGAVLCGIGFTMSLFIAALAFEGPQLAAASMGVLIASFVAAVLGLLLVRLMPAAPR